MSHRQLASCPRCGFLASTGWTEPGLPEAVFCGACDTRMSIASWDRRAERRPDALALHFVARGPVEVSSPRGRVRRTKLAAVRREAPRRVPLVDRLHEGPSGEVSLVWGPDLAGEPCPGCGEVGRLCTFEQALARCPRCGEGPLEETDPEALVTPRR